MKVGILGTGEVGKVLADGFAARGHKVMIGTRNPQNAALQRWATRRRGRVAIGSFSDAARYGRLLVLAVRGSAAIATLEGAGLDHFSGKILIDVTMPWDTAPGAPSPLFVGTTDSLGERVQRAVRAARVVKTFTVGSNQMVDPRIRGEHRLELLIAGNNVGAKRKVSEIVRSFGWTGTIDIGDIEGARWLESLAPLWLRLGNALDDYDHVFSFARN